MAKSEMDSTGKPYLPAPLLTTQTASSSASRARSLCRNTLVKTHIWSASSSSWSANAPSIIFMDEIDSAGSSRGESGSSGGDSEVQRTNLALLDQLDGFESTKNIKVIMTCLQNRFFVLRSSTFLAKGFE